MDRSKQLKNEIYYTRNKEKIRAKAKKYYKLNKKKRLKKMQEYYRKHRKKLIRYSIDYYYIHQDFIKDRRKEAQRRKHGKG